MNAIRPTAIGRDDERMYFRERFLADPYSGSSIAFYVGPGGIGKTQLLQLPMADARQDGRYPVLELVDMYSTENRYIRGLQKNLIQQLGKENFPRFTAPNGDTPPNFRSDLETYCRKTPVLLPIDTFENVAGSAVAGWILGREADSLLVPGLILVIGSREGVPSKMAGAGYIEQIEVKGFSVGEAIRFYAERSGEQEVETSLQEFIAKLVEKTRGHPLWLEMTYTWLGANLWTVESLEKLSREDFDRSLMTRVREFGEEGVLTVYNDFISPAIYQTMICMAYMRRRFDQEMLEKLIEKRFLRLGEGESPEKVIAALKRYFFVKERKNGHTELQLHDALTDLSMQYLWETFGRASSEVRSEFQRWVIEEYDELIWVCSI